eukprot:646723_1
MNPVSRIFTTCVCKRLPIYRQSRYATCKLASRSFIDYPHQVPTAQLVNRLHPGHQIATAGERTSVQKAAAQMIQAKIGCLLVVDEKDENKMVGVITERDCMRAISESQSLNDVIIRDIMTLSADMITAEPNISSEECFKIMLSHNIRHLPLVDDTFAICRVLSIKDIAAAYVTENNRKIHEKEEEAEYWAWRANLDDAPSLER